MGDHTFVWAKQSLQLLSITFLLVALTKSTFNAAPNEQSRPPQIKGACLLKETSAQATKAWAQFHPANKKSCSNFGYQGNNEAE